MLLDFAIDSSQISFFAKLSYVRTLANVSNNRKRICLDESERDTTCRIRSLNDVTPF